MTDPQHVAQEHEAQLARFEDFIKRPQAYVNPPPGPSAPVPTRRVEFLGRDGEDAVEHDMPQRLGPNVGHYPGGNDAQEVVRISDVPDTSLTEAQRAVRDAVVVPPPPAQGPPQPSPGLLAYITSAAPRPPAPQPPPSTQEQARWPLYATKRNSDAEYGAYKADRPPANVEPPRGFELGLVEICTWMPDWLIIPELLIRVMRNGADARVLAKMELSAIDQLDWITFERRRNSLIKQMSNHGKAKFGVPANQAWSMWHAQNAGPENDLTADDWSNPTSRPWGSWKLADIYRHVPRQNWPTGEDRLLFTQCLEYAAASPGLDLDTSQIPWMVENLGFQMPPARANGNRDQWAVALYNVPDPVKTD